jgi:3-methyladenine DNA glycosylase AlkD
MKARSPSSSIRTKRSDHFVAKKIARGNWTCAGVLRELRALGVRRNADGMARFGIRAKIVYGVAKPKMDQLARRIGRDHELALELWKTGVHDACILAGMIDVAAKVTPLRWSVG